VKKRPILIATIAAAAYIVTVLQRGSLGVAALLATERFHTTASQLAALSVIQLIFYAGMQVPVGILLDRFGAKAMLLVGSLAIAAGQCVLANALDLGAALTGRALVGFGDAFTFITMLRLIKSWYSGKRAARIQLLVSNLGQLGQILSSLPFAFLLGSVGWSVAFSYLSLMSLLIAIAVLVSITDAPSVGKSHRHSSIGAVLSGLRSNLRLEQVRLGFWIHFHRPVG